MTGKIRGVSILLAGAFLLVACGKPASSDPTAAAAAPAGTAKVTVTSTHAAYPRADVPTWAAPTVVAFRDDVSDLASVIVTISTYDLRTPTKADWAKRVSPAKGQARIELFLTRHKVNEKLPFTAGVYDAGKQMNEAEMTALARVAVAGGGSVVFSPPQGSVEVTSVTADSISGRFDIKDASTQMAGEFRSPLK